MSVSLPSFEAAFSQSQTYNLSSFQGQSDNFEDPPASASSELFFCHEGSARWARQRVPHGTSASTSAAFFYDAAFAHTMTRGLVPAILGQVTVLSLIKVTGILRGPQ